MIWSKRVGQQAARKKWEAQLHWLRLRYEDSVRATHCLNLLSRSQACGRIALYFQRDEAIARLYIGVPEVHVRFARQMAADFGLSLQAETISPPLDRLTAVSQLPWAESSGRDFVAHISAGETFATPAEGSGGSFWPQPGAAKTGDILTDWSLPEPPPAGLAVRPQWAEQSLPDSLVQTNSTSFAWPLGWSQTNVPLHRSGPVNLYGRQEAVTHWLVAQVVQILAGDAANLVVIDGAGDLVPQLKRKAAVTRLLGEQLAYVDLDSASLMGGFNPLAPVPGETDAMMIHRWQRWVQSMGAPKQSLPLLAQAHQDGVADIPALRQWLKQQERQGQQTAVSGLSMILNRLTASRTIREWLEWPTNRYDGLPVGALFFACKGSGWERRQLLKAVLLAVWPVPGVRLILHGIPWQEVETALLEDLPALLVSNGPALSQSTVVLTSCHAAGLAHLRTRFPVITPQLSENLALLAVGEGAVLQENGAVWATWHKGKSDGDQS